MDKYFPDGDKTNNNNVYGYARRRPWFRFSSSAATISRARTS